MSNNIDTRAPFFPNTRGEKKVGNSGKSSGPSEIRPTRSQNIEGNAPLAKGQMDARVDINDAIKDFSRIKKAVDGASDIDNSEKIAALKAKINSGTYEIDYDGLADKILSSEF